jgi:hypothetical protein
MFDLRRTLERLTRLGEAEERHERESLYVIGGEFARRPPLPSPEAEARAVARCQHLGEQEQWVAAAWERALSKIGAARRFAADALAALVEAEQRRDETGRRLAALPSDADPVLVQRRAVLRSELDTISVLVSEREADYRRACRSIWLALDRTFRADVMAQEQRVADAQAYFDEVRQRAKAELAREQRMLAAIGAARAQAHDERAIERHIGRQVTPDPVQISRRDVRKAEQRALADALSRWLDEKPSRGAQ